MKLRDECSSMFTRHLYSHHGRSTRVAYELLNISVYPLMILVIAIMALHIAYVDDMAISADA